MNVRLKYDLHFNAGVYYRGNTILNNYSLRLWMITNTELAEDQNTAFERIKYFVYNHVDNTMFIDRGEQEQCAKFLQAGLSITTMPGDPVDQLIGIMLYHKLNAIMEQRMNIVETELSSAQGQAMTYLHSEGENTLGVEAPAWWLSTDLAHSDFALPESEKVVSMQTTTAWRDLDLAWSELPPSMDHGNIVVFADFKPNNETK
jgi:hypothetical protein